MTQISILIPCFNAEPFLRQCLDTVISQDLDDCEVICFNDGSSDGTEAILKDYTSKSEKIALIESSENIGVSKARARLFEAASGDYIWFIDADDMMIDDAVKHAKRRITAHRPDLICFDFFKLDASGNGKLQENLSYYDGYTKRKDLPSFLTTGPVEALKVLYENGGCHLWTKVFRKRLIASFDKLDYSLSCFEDMPITTAIYSRAERVLFDQSAVVIYRENYNSLTNTITYRKLLALLRSTQIAVDLYKSVAGENWQLTKFRCDQLRWATLYQRHSVGNTWPADRKREAHELLQRIKPRLLDVLRYQIMSGRRKVLRHHWRNVRRLDAALKG